MDETIMGVDPGLADTGWGVVMKRGPKTLYVAHGCIKTSTALPLHLRLRDIYIELNAVIAAYSPSVGVAESLYFAKNVSSAIPVAQARGVVLVSFALASMKCQAYTPGAIKQAVTGMGGADKVTVQRMVKILLGLKEIPSPNHAADALACALCYAHGGAPCTTV